MGIMKKLTGWLRAADQEAEAPEERSVEPAAMASQAREEFVAEAVSVPAPERKRRR